MDGYQTGVYGYKKGLYGVPAKKKGVFEDPRPIYKSAFSLFSGTCLHNPFSFSQRRMIFTNDSLHLTLSIFNLIPYIIPQQGIQKRKSENVLQRFFNACMFPNY